MRLAAVELVDRTRSGDLLDQPWDVIFTTSLLSAADLRALLPGQFRALPLVLYMHENQAAYPQGANLPELAKRDVQFALTNLTSLLSADLVMWNSRWNRDSFFQGINEILRHAPSLRIGDVVQHINDRSCIAWPPVEAPPQRVKRASKSDEFVRVLWPHRWEHDKGPEELLELAERYTHSHNLRWTILGEQYRTVPPALRELQRRFTDRIDHMGYLTSRQKYWAALHSCDWVLSTARHEFFGIAVAEALLAGCLPWLPNRLSYPELLPALGRNLSPMQPPLDAAAVRSAIQQHLTPVTRSVERWDLEIRKLAESGRNAHVSCPNSPN